MISVRVTRNEDMITRMKVSGHAGSDEYGKDLVCAAVSGIVFGLCNALDLIAGIDTCTIGNNLITIEIHEPDTTTETIMNTGLIQLKTVQEMNQNFIKITEV